jgi:hypothetical protein
MTFRPSAAFLVAALAAALIGVVMYWHLPNRLLRPNQVITVNAKVKFSKIEGGCWLLEASSGTYLPQGLPAEFKVDGMRVVATLQLAQSQAHYCPHGDGIVVISKIDRATT